MIFKKVDGTEIVLEDYIKNYIKEHPDVELLIGCDSQNRRKQTSFALVVAMYNPGHGAHVVFKRWKERRGPSRNERLLKEVWSSVECAEELKRCGINNIKYIDVDLNPSPKYRSNDVLSSAKGMVEGMGYEMRYKTLGPLVTSMADTIARK